VALWYEHIEGFVPLEATLWGVVSIFLGRLLKNKLHFIQKTSKSKLVRLSDLFPILRW
jgi:hypothetical protein